MQYRRIRWGINVTFRVCPPGLTRNFTEFFLDNADLVQSAIFAVAIDTY